MLAMAGRTGALLEQLSRKSVFSAKFKASVDKTAVRTVKQVARGSGAKVRL